MKINIGDEMTARKSYPQQVIKAADDLRETWPFLFDGHDLPAEEVATVALATVPDIVARDRLAMIADAHGEDIGKHGLTSGLCVECGHAWPCPTNVWATSERDPLACWDPADDEDESVIDHG